MDTIEIKKRLNAIILNAPFNRLMGFVNAYCKDEKPEDIKIGMELSFVDWLTDWVLGAPADVKSEFLAKLDEYDEHPMRICDICGKFMIEGYITANFERYCSDECRLEGYKKTPNGRFVSDEEAMALIEQDFCEDSEDFYYTEW